MSEPEPSMWRVFMDNLKGTGANWLHCWDLPCLSKIFLGRAGRPLSPLMVVDQNTLIPKHDHLRVIASEWQWVSGLSIPDPHPVQKCLNNPWQLISEQTQWQRSRRSIMGLVPFSNSSIEKFSVLTFLNWLSSALVNSRNMLFTMWLWSSLIVTSLNWNVF